MNVQPQGQPSSGKRLAQAVLKFLAEGWNGPATDTETDRGPVNSLAPRPDVLFRATRAAFGGQR
jgi:hypothetical protein